MTATPASPLWRSNIFWAALAVIGAGALGVVALSRGETINAIWLVAASVSVYLIAYRFYGQFIAHKVLRIDPSRPTPANRFNDGLDYCPTDKNVLFGHHFAAITGAGPLIGPVLAAQFGFLPGLVWILVGVVLASRGYPGSSESNRPIAGLEDALVYAAATDYLERRRRTIARLRRSGVQIIDVAPPGLARHLVNQYWEVKRAGRA